MYNLFHNLRYVILLNFVVFVKFPHCRRETSKLKMHSLPVQTALPLSLPLQQSALIDIIRQWKITKVRPSLVVVQLMSAQISPGFSCTTTTKLHNLCNFRCLDVLHEIGECQDEKRGETLHGQNNGFGRDSGR